MNLDDINCPQFVCFQDFSMNYDTSGSDNVAGSINQISECEGDVTLTGEESSSFAPSEEEFVVHKRTTRSLASKLKKDITIPKPFHFETHSRLKSKDAVCSVNNEKDFASQLRQHGASHLSTCGVTKTKAFNLTENKTKKGEASYVPLAEQIKAYQKTPDRFHSSANKKFQPQEHWSPPKLRPRTPKLQAVKRHRAVNALSREQQEEKELEEIKAYKFHAHAVDPRVYKPDIIVKEKNKESTKSISFDFKTSQRAAVEQPATNDSHTSYEFRARPLPKNILLGPTGLGEKPEIKITKPISPTFCTQKRIEKRKLIEEQDDGTPAKKGKIQAKPSSKPKLRKAKKSKSKQALVHPVPTEIKPFSFDKVDKQRYFLKEKKIQEEIEKKNKAFIFKAQPLPSPSASALPKVQKKNPTKPEPFNFILDTCNLHHTTTNFKENSVSFKAQPATVLKKEPFVPEKLHKCTAEFKEFELNTGRRASARLKLLEQKEAEEREKENIYLARKALEEEKERQEIRKLRQELVHKANPVRQYKVLEIKHNSKRLTEPISPQFETDKRLKVRNNN